MIHVKPSELAEFPDLIPWLLSGVWKDEFDASALQVGGLTVVNMRTIDPESEDYEDIGNDADLVVSADLRDPNGRRQHSLVSFYLDSEDEEFPVDFVSECSCPTGYTCKHVAMTLQALTLLASRAKATEQAGHEARVDPRIRSWLTKIRRVEKETSTPAKSARPYNKFLAYCIEYHQPSAYSGGVPRLVFCLRMGSRTKAGEWNIEHSHANADPTRPAKYMADEDLAICSLIHARKHKMSVWGSEIPLSGPDWLSILRPAAATGRLFFNRRSRDYRASHINQTRELSEGPAIHTDADWELMADGGARPILRLPKPDLLIADTQPLIYVDPEEPCFGAMESDTPHEILAVWAEGPVIPAVMIPELQNELKTIPTQNPLPVPAEKPAEILSGLTPVPRLRITEIAVGVYLLRRIGAHLEFLYPGCQPLPPLNSDSPPRHAWLEGDKRFILERDPAVEDAIASELEPFGLLPLHRILSESELNSKNRHCRVIDHPKATAADWLEIITHPEFEALKTKGWIIETDPRLGLTIHDIGDFFPAIESDPDHGIDWFRFDVTAEFGGKNLSLIPHIARAISEDWHDRYRDPESRPDHLLIPCDNPADGHIRFPASRFLDMVEQVRHLFHGTSGTGPLRLDRLSAAGVADVLTLDTTETTRSLATLGRNLRDIQGLPPAEVPATIRADLRHYQADGFRWLQFLSKHGLHGILADDMGLGKTLQTLAHLAALQQQHPGEPSLVIAPTSVVPNWAAETTKFAPHLKVLVLHGGNRADNFDQITGSDIVLTSYPLLVRDFDELAKHQWRALVLDEAQYIKNPKALSAISACRLKAAHRLCLSGTPMENHLGELWSLMRFLMPGFLADEKTFNSFIRKPIERDHSRDAQLALNRRVSPLILRRTKDQVATELPEKTTLIHGIDLSPKQTDLYESVRAAMDVRVREAIHTKGLAKSHIIVLDALLKLRQICCHPQLLKSEAARRVLESAKLEFLTAELLPQLIEEGRRILLFSQFTSMLELIEEHLKLESIPYLKLTGQTKERADLVTRFQSGEVPIFLISLKAGGTGLNLTAADTVIHYDPWWNPAAENQATDRAHRIGQTKPVFVHKLVCRGTIEDRILELQQKKSALVEALLSEDTSKLKIDPETLSHLLAPVG
jgi:superfamily II DNA or RNA helicase